MAVLQKQMTRSAYAARLMIFPRRFTQQSLCHKPRKRCFAGIFLAGKQPSVRTVFPMISKLPPLVLMPRINHIGKYKLLNKSVIIQGNVRGRLKSGFRFRRPYRMCIIFKQHDFLLVYQSSNRFIHRLFTQFA
jgi:hypothetical protein